MDPLSIIAVAASVLQIAEMGGRLSVKLFTLSRKIKNADKSIASISAEIASTGAILQQLGLQLKDDEQLRLCSKEAVAGAETIVKDCQSVFSEIDQALDGRISDNKLITGWKQRVKFPFLEAHVNLLRSNLERLKTSLLVILNVLVLAEQVRSREALPMLREQKELIQNLVDDKKALEKEYRSYQKAIEQSNTSQFSTAAAPIVLLSSPPGKFETTARETTKDLSFSTARSVEPHQKDEPELPGFLHVRKQEIEHHGLLVSNLLQEISLLQYKIGHTIRDKMEQVILKAHWEQWKPLQRHYGPDILLRFFQSHDQIMRFWVDKDEGQGAIGPPFAYQQRRPPSQETRVILDMQQETLDSESDLTDVLIEFRREETRDQKSKDDHLTLDLSEEMLLPPLCRLEPPETPAVDEEKIVAEYEARVSELQQNLQEASREKLEMEKRMVGMMMQFEQSAGVVQVQELAEPTPEEKRLEAERDRLKEYESMKYESMMRERYAQSRPMVQPQVPPTPPLPPRKDNGFRSRISSVLSVAAPAMSVGTSLGTSLGGFHNPFGTKRSRPGVVPPESHPQQSNTTDSKPGWPHGKRPSDLPAELPADVGSAQLQSKPTTEVDSETVYYYFPGHSIFHSAYASNDYIEREKMKTKRLPSASSLPLTTQPTLQEGSIVESQDIPAQHQNDEDDIKDDIKDLLQQYTTLSGQEIRGVSLKLRVKNMEDRTGELS